jgi:imidazolonepropionase-like amidohydrolase
MKQLLVKGKLLIDGTGRPPIEKGAILIEGDRIAAIGSGDNVIRDPDAQVLDCGNEVLIPGLIDCHNHLSMDPTQENWPARLNDDDIELTIRAIINLAVDLKAGVTTARCLGDKNFLDVQCKKAIENKRVIGPKLLVAGKGMRASHGHGMVGYPFDGPDQIRRGVRENLKAGADLIKLFITGTIRAGREITCYLSREEISVAVYEAHGSGVPVTVHCIGGIGFDDCLAAKVDCIEHGYFLNDRQVEQLVQSECWLVLTPSPFFTEERIQTLPPELSYALRRDRDEVAERMTTLIRSGVRFAAGTDGMHGGLAKEVEYLVRMGASTERAFQAITCNAAALMGLGDTVGTLEPRKIANIVGLEGNPLENIKALQKVRTVIAQGKIYYPETHPISEIPPLSLKRRIFHEIV